MLWCRHSVFCLSIYTRLHHWLLKEKWLAGMRFITCSALSTNGSQDAAALSPFSLPASPIFISLHVIRVPYYGQNGCLLIHTNGADYLINCPENTLLAYGSSHGKLSSLTDVFCTHASVANLAGLSTLSHEHYGSKCSHLRVHGATSTRIHLARHVLFSQAKEPIIGNKYFEISRIPIYSNGLGLEDSSRVSPYGDIRECLHDRFNVGGFDGTIAYAYMFTAHPAWNKISIDRCIDINIPHDAEIVKLVRGENITLPDGRVISPLDVCDESDNKAESFLVVDCPTVRFLDNFVSNSRLTKLAEHFFIEDSPSTLKLVVHFTPESILRSDPYLKWMQSFSPSVDHLIINDHESDPVSTGFNVRKAIRHNLVDRHIFPMLPSVNKLLTHERSNRQLIIDGARITYGDVNLRYDLRPLTGFDSTDCQQGYGDNEEGLIPRQNRLTENAWSTKGFAELTELKQKLEKTLNDLEVLRSSLPRYPEVVFLGTGAGTIPTRNDSAILLNINESSSILLDCGSNTWGHLVDFYGEDKAKLLLKHHLKCIFVSHLHTDHFQGIFALLAVRRMAFVEEREPIAKLSAMMPSLLFSIIRKTGDIIADLDPLPIPRKNRSVAVSALSKSATSRLRSMGISSIILPQVDHPALARGIVLRTIGDKPNPSKKIVYSGDTRPSISLVRAGHGADLLIHEATYADPYADIAKSKAHCTVSEAIKVAEAMKAKHTILTHFGPRNMSPLEVKSPELDDRTGIAFDFMRISLHELFMLPYVTSLLRCIYNPKGSNDDEDLDKEDTMISFDSMAQKSLSLSASGAHMTRSGMI